jgi:biopolymer transport protein ExbD
MAGVVGPRGLEGELSDTAARMSVLRIEQSDLERERPRVLEQIEELGEPVAPWSPAIRLARARMHPVPNAGHEGGLAEDLNRMSLDDVRSFARRAYCPANARIAVAGDVDPADVAAQVERLFAALPAGEATPEPPRVEPLVGNVHVDRCEAPGPGYEARRGICIAYACDFGEPANHAAAHAFGFWRVDGAKRPDGFIVLPRDDWIEVLWKGDDRPVEDVIAEFDALVEDFALHATGPAAAAKIRVARREMQAVVAKYQKLGLQGLWREEERSRSLPAALHLAIPRAELSDWDMALAAIEPLTNRDMRRFVESWHVADRRVVVDVRGWRPPPEPEPEPDATTTEPTPSRAPSTALVVEVRVTVTWDEATQSVHRKIADREYAKDDDLQKAIAEAHKALANDGKADAPVAIDADPRIPWNEVITVVNLIKRCGIEKIEFAMGAPPKRDAPK